VAADYPRDTLVRQWLDGVEPAWTLLTFDSLRALRQEPSAVRTAIQIANDLSADEIDGSWRGATEASSANQHARDKPDYFDGRPVTYGFSELDMLVPAYAATIHKSQGSEYPAVVIPVMPQHYAMLQRNLLYTGVTRGKRLVVLVGQKKAVAIAVRNVSGRRRWSKLAEWLRSGSPP
jgi:exodeoxyribonuclease V alpha subunit